MMDRSLGSLIITNLLALVQAYYFDWSLVSLMVLYWAQSVIIGIANMYRILALERFTTTGLQIGGRPVKAVPSTQRNVAFFFAGHYGFFHLMYLVFIFTQLRDETFFLTLEFWAATLLFALNHANSYRYNRDLDRQGSPNIGTMMFLPYLRVVPMHLIVVFGSFIAGTKLDILMFGLLKTAADVMMHLKEHAQLRKGS